MDTSKLKRNIMMRVYGIWLLRRVAPTMLFQVLFLVLAIHLFTGSVFIAQVLRNAGTVFGGGIYSFLQFAFAAVWYAKPEIKFEMLLATVMGGLFLWSIKRAIVSYEMIRRGR